jgi:DNA-binding LacI/PurR family transcriptional regulator
MVTGPYPREQGGWGGLPAGATYLRLLLRQAPDVTAVFAVSDLIAAGALQALYAERVQVPRQISIVGFDDTFATELLFRPIYRVTCGVGNRLSAPD